ncbi:fimbrial chaperone [Scandinavium manionii]|uniref:fimbrial chaperone n=1 Tax=Scandinavium manionii TaxID=2926520 RepID=UPI00216686A8|nr:fimbrial chaperone [Scandinavium manionii]MCS2150256.1 fimbrial chaperone [Scandinavium manionii]
MMKAILTKVFVPLISAVSCLIAAPASYADIVISGTRVVYPASAKNVTVKLENRGIKPLLVQTWIDDGRENANPQELNVPFLVTPPVSRVDPGKGQSIKVTYLGGQLPQDKESLFWFNVLEIPPKTTDGADKNILQLAFRTRIKVFYRPEGLKGAAGDAVKTLQWSVNQSGKALYIDVKNPSPYHVSFSRAQLVSGKNKYSLDTHTVPPGGKESFKVTGLSAVPAGTKIECDVINDFGGSIKSEFTI